MLCFRHGQALSFPVETRDKKFTRQKNWQILFEKKQSLRKNKFFLRKNKNWQILFEKKVFSKKNKVQHFVF